MARTRTPHASVATPWRIPQALLITALAAALVAAWASSAHGLRLTGRGQLHGSGSGTARLEGSGTFYVRGTCVLTLRDSEDAAVEIQGFAFARELPSGFKVYRGSGWARVSGNGAMVKLDGDIDQMFACGGGSCYMRGDGRYRVRSRTRLWKQTGVYVRFDLTR